MVLIFIAIVTPFRLAFVEVDDPAWTGVDYMIDLIFAMDITICFFSAFEDENEELVHNQCTIASTYIKSWFFVDLISIIPLD